MGYIKGTVNSFTHKGNACPVYFLVTQIFNTSNSNLKNSYPYGVKIQKLEVIQKGEPKMENETDYYATEKEAAIFFEVSTRMIRNYKTMGMPSKGERPVTYPLRQCFLWALSKGHIKGASVHSLLKRT